MNELQEWPLGQLALKCHSLQTLNLEKLYTYEANRSMLLEFAGRAITSSRCFTELDISWTGTSVSDGAQFFKTLEDSECSQLTTISISFDKQWFEGTDECMGPLLTFLAK